MSESVEPATYPSTHPMPHAVYAHDAGAEAARTASPAALARFDLAQLDRDAERCWRHASAAQRGGENVWTFKIAYLYGWIEARERRATQ